MKQKRKRKTDAGAVRQFYIEKLEVYPSFPGPVAVGPSWVIQLWGGRGGG